MFPKHCPMEAGRAFFYAAAVPPRGRAGSTGGIWGMRSHQNTPYYVVGVLMTTDFTQLNLHPQLVQAVTERGYTAPMPI